MKFIDKNEYSKIIEVLPILCADILVQNNKGEYLLVKRENEPLKGQWWLIGGRVLKGETMIDAAIRKLKEETGIIVNSVAPIGYYEDTNEVNTFDLSKPRHSVSIVFSTVIDDSQKIQLDSQSSSWGYFPELPKNIQLKSFILKRL